MALLLFSARIPDPKKIFFLQVSRMFCMGVPLVVAKVSHSLLTRCATATIPTIVAFFFAVLSTN